MADQDIEEADSQDISEIRRKALALLERCGATDSDDEIPDYDKDEDSSEEEEEQEVEMKNIRSSEFQKKKPKSPRRKKGNSEDDEEKGSDDEQSYGDEELDPLVKAVRELSYSLETDMVERQESTVSRLTEDGGVIVVNGSICFCCNCCCCRRWTRRTQCLVVWILLILLLGVSYIMFLTQYPRWKRKHGGG